MATYAPSSLNWDVSGINLSVGLYRNMQGEKQKALIQLLSPVQLAAESSLLIKDLVDTGDIYHPIAWSSAEAYEFLKDAPQYEQCGVVVRLPDWWKKRNRPLASVTIGENDQAF